MDSGHATREKMVALLGLKNENDPSFFHFASGSVVKWFESYQSEMSQATDRASSIDRTMRSLASTDSSDLIIDVHPAWIAQALSNESARVVGIMLRFLPSKHVRYVMDHLPARIRERLPSPLDALAVPAPILNYFRRSLETKFTPMETASDIEMFSFHHIYCLDTDDLTLLFHDLGIHEMAMALAEVDPSVLKILFNRLDVKEARSLEQRLHAVGKLSASLGKEAKYNVLEMTIAKTDSYELLKEIGIMAFCKALTENDNVMVKRLKQKLNPKTGYLIQRYFHEHVQSNQSQDHSMERQKIILERLYILSKAGEISTEWAPRYAPEWADSSVGNQKE